MPYSQAALVLAYAKDVLGASVPSQWNEKTLSHYPNFEPSRETTHRERFLKKPSVRKGFERAFPNDRELAHQMYAKSYSTINRALRNLAQKGLVHFGRGMGGIKPGGDLNKRMLQRRAGLDLSAFFRLTAIGRVVSRDILQGAKRAPHKAIIDAVGNEIDIICRSSCSGAKFLYDIEVYKGNSPFGLLMVVRSFMGLSLKEAKEIASHGPLLLMQVGSHKEARKICKEVNAMGAYAKVHEPAVGAFAFCFQLLRLQEALGGSWAKFGDELGVSQAIVRKIRNRELLNSSVGENIKAKLESNQINSLLQHRILSVLE